MTGKRTKIYLLPRENDIFLQPMTIITIDEQGIPQFDFINKGPDILCDSCGNVIETEMIMVLSLSKGYIWGTLCENCKEAYWKEIKVEEIKLGESIVD